METTVIVLSVICVALALLCLYLILYVYLTNKMLENKDLIITELQWRINLVNKSNALLEVTRKMKEFSEAISSMGTTVNEKGKVVAPGK